MKGGLASSRYKLHLCTLQLLPTDLEVGFCASLANSVNRLMLLQGSTTQLFRASAVSASMIQLCPAIKDEKRKYQQTCTRRRVSGTPGWATKEASLSCDAQLLYRQNTHH